MSLIPLTLLVLLNILLALIWWRIITHTVGKTHYGRRIALISLVMSGAFALFPQRSMLFHLPALYYTQITNFADGNLWLMTAAGVGVLFFLLTLGLKKRPTTHSRLAHLVFGLLRLLMRQRGSALLPTVTVLWVVVAGLEEWLKSGTSNALRDRYHLVISDILLFGMLTALGFAFIENIVYLLHSLHFTDLSRRFTLSTTGGLLLKRSISSRVMHICYTGLIVRGSYQARSAKKYRYWLPGGILLGVGLHVAYNLFLVQAHMLALMILLLLSYFFLARLLYKSDRLYVSLNTYR